MRQKIVAGNWKMNGQAEELAQLTQQLVEQTGGIDAAQIIVFPPAPYLSLVNELLKASNIALGAQNIYPKDCGAYTGEISAPMIRDYNARYVLVGHSERRQLFQEDENFVAQKFHHVKDHGMIPVLCVGETLNEREKGQTEQVVTNQLLAVHSGKRIPRPTNPIPGRQLSKQKAMITISNWTLFKAQNIRSQYIRKEWNCPHGPFSLNRAS